MNIATARIRRVDRDLVGMVKARLVALVCIVALLLVSGCASRPVLIARSAAVPPNIDFSGDWVLRDGTSPALRGGATEEQLIWIPPESASRGEVRRRPSRRSSEPAVRVFLETGKALKITQTAHGLFISYDRAVVEEFTFGENRLVSVGPIEAQRVSGWEGDTLVVETMDDDGSRLTESWHLEGDMLVRDIAITRGEKPHLRAQQRFERM